MQTALEKQTIGADNYKNSTCSTNQGNPDGMYFYGRNFHWKHTFVTIWKTHGLHAQACAHADRNACARTTCTSMRRRNGNILKRFLHLFNILFSDSIPESQNSKPVRRQTFHKVMPLCSYFSPLIEDNSWGVHKSQHCKKTDQRQMAKTPAHMYKEIALYWTGKLAPKWNWHYITNWEVGGL